MSAKLDRVFHALADGTRRSMVRRLARASFTVTELAKPYKMSLAAVAKHVKVLVDAGVVIKTREGRVQRCHLDFAPLDRATRTIEEYREFWQRQIDSLERYLDRQTGRKHDRNRR